MQSNYWLTITAQEHVNIVRNKGYTQINMGPKAPLDQMKQGDWILYYSPTIYHKMPKSMCQKFTGLSYIKDHHVYQKGNDDSALWRRNVDYFHCKPRHIEEFHPHVDFLREHNHWIDALYAPFFEISQNDFIFIAKKIIVPFEERCIIF